MRKHLKKHLKRLMLFGLLGLCGSSFLFATPSFAGGEEEFLQMLQARQHQNLQVIEARRQKYCWAIGGVWDPTRQLCHVSIDLEQTCALLGGKWQNGLCHFPGKCLNR